MEGVPGWRMLEVDSMENPMDPGRSRAFAGRRVAITGASGSLGLALLVLSMAIQPAAAQVEKFMWGPGSKVGPNTKIKPQNCVTAKDGSLTCDTKVENPPGDTPAKPSYNTFKN